MTLPTPSKRWAIDARIADHTEAITAFGFTERQARFLVEVMIHSGVFVERQYCAFAGIVHGQKTHDFLKKLVERGYARPIQVGAVHRGRLFHIGHKPLYAAIGQADNRHRKPMPMGRMIERLMVLDGVLADRTFTWLGTEFDKRSYFQHVVGDRLKPHEFPQITFGTEERSTTRLFPDKLPIGVQRERIDHVFMYLVTRPVPVDFRMFLWRHAELLRALSRWTIRVLVPAPFVKAIRVFGHAARETLATPISPMAADELQWYFRERLRRERTRSVSDDDRFGQASAAFRAPLFGMLYRVWREAADPVIGAAQSPVLRDVLERQEGRVEFVQLSHQYLHLASLVGVA